MIIHNLHKYPPLQRVHWEGSYTLGWSNTTLQIFFTKGVHAFHPFMKTFSNIYHSALALKFNGAFGGERLSEMPPLGTNSLPKRHVHSRYRQHLQKIHFEAHLVIAKRSGRKWP